MPVFENRTDAGKKLSEVLGDYANKRPLILALPRGGVPVAVEVAESLHARLDTVPVRKVGAPFSPEFGVGAVAPPDIVVFDDASIRASGASQAAIEGVVGEELHEMERRGEQYQSGRFSVGYVPHIIIIVDDGIAGGMTMRAAAQSVRKRYPKTRIVLAAPVCISETLSALKKEGHEVVCLAAPKELYAIGQAYEDFTQVTDEEVLRCLKVQTVPAK